MSDDKRDTIKQLKESGLTYSEIGEAMGISRQRVQQIIGLTDRERSGLLRGSEGRCDQCHEFSSRLDAHHDDYSQKPTRLLCQKCHHAAHMQAKKEAILKRASSSGNDQNRYGPNSYMSLEDTATRLGLSMASVRRLAARDAEIGAEGAPVKIGGRWLYPVTWIPVR